MFRFLSLSLALVLLLSAGLYLRHRHITDLYGSRENREIILGTLAKKKHHQRNPGFEKQLLREKVGEGGELPFGMSSVWRAWDDSVSQYRLTGESPFDTISEIGPRGVGGRTRAIHIDPRNPDYVITGGVSGGIWRSFDRAVSWTVLDDQAANLSVTSLTYNPFNPDMIYYSTGEVRGGGGLGEGVYRSTDNGETFTQLPSSLNHSDFRYTWKIAHSLTDSLTVYVATYQGLYRSTDAGASWEEVLQVDNRDANDILTFRDGSVIAAMEGNGLYYSPDGSAGSFSALNTDVFPAQYSRLKLAYAANQQEFIYCMVAVDAGDDAAPRIYKSTDQGQTWSEKATPITSGTQSRYNMMLGVHPDNPNRVICGAVLANYSENGATSWFFAGISHADFHEFVPMPDNHNQFLVGNDGGVFLYRWNEIFNVIDRNNRLNITQFYGGSHDHSDDITLGGTQDNGTIRVKRDADNYIFGADGGYAHVHQQTDNLAYFSTQNDGLFRSPNWKGGVGVPASIMYPPMGNEGVNFINAYEMNYADGDQLYYRTHKGLWRSLNRGNTWQRINGDDLSGITRLALSKDTDPHLYFVAAGAGGHVVYRTTDAVYASGFETVLRMPDYPELFNGASVRMDVHPFNNDRVLMAYFNYTGDKDQVWLLENAGAATPELRNVTGNLPPNLPVNTIKFHPQNPDSIFLAGTDFGLYYTVDAGSTWVKETRLPNVQVFDLRIRESDGRIFIFTYGRGIWMATLKPLPDAFAPLPFTENFDRGSWKRSARVIPMTQSSRVKVRMQPEPARDNPALVLDQSAHGGNTGYKSWIQSLLIPGPGRYRCTYEYRSAEVAPDTLSGVYLSPNAGGEFFLMKNFPAAPDGQWYRDTFYFETVRAVNALISFFAGGSGEYPNGGLALDNIAVEQVSGQITPVNENLLTALRVYPNPARDRITMEWADNETADRVELKDAAGKSVASWSPEQSRAELRLPPQASPGMYFLVFYRNGRLWGTRALVIAE